MSSKRAREPPNVDVSLVEIFEDLTHQDTEVRLRAAHRLLKEHVTRKNAEQTRPILKRLFRGLCSGRKAARLGFSIALTETLAEVSGEHHSIDPSEVLDILENSTIPESNTSGQDGRDHYFGRVFGCDAIIKSKILFIEPSRSLWHRLLDIICAISAKKPWLRQECGWILFQCIESLPIDRAATGFASQIIEKFVQHKLARTPEGLAIWIAVSRKCQVGNLPAGVWKHDDPLAKKDIQVLSQVLKDARASSKNDADFEAQGSASWSPQLPFAWDVVLSELFQPSQSKKRVNFVDFWRAAVDEGLFSPANSPERKHWGMLVLQKAIKAAPTDLLFALFSKNVTKCLLQSLRDAERYLQRGAQKTLQTVTERSKADAEAAGVLVTSLIENTSTVDFEVLLKTKSFQGLFTDCPPQASLQVATALSDSVLRLGAAGKVDTQVQMRNLINVQMRLFSHAVHTISTLEPSSNATLETLTMVLQCWTELYLKARSTGEEEAAQRKSIIGLLQQRLAAGFEQMLKLGNDGRLFVLSCISKLKRNKFSADTDIVAIITEGWAHFDRYYKQGVSNGDEANKSPKKQRNSQPASHADQAKSIHGDQATITAQGLALMYGLVIFQLHCDELEAVPILEELIAFEQDAGRQLQTSGPVLTTADGLIEILLNFASKPSKFLRRITMDIFEAFTSQISRQGLSSLTDILKTKESKAGQEELFEANATDIGEEDDDDDDVVDSDVDMLDSDVEIVHAENAGSSTSSDSSQSDSELDSGTDDSDSDSVSGSDVADSADEALQALETSLADALGTRKITSGDIGVNADSDSDSDMDDEQMLTLDAKLSEVFRTRAAAQSQSKSKQQQNKAARENVTNFKNRVLDMIDIYFKREYSNSNSLALILPLLSLARSSSVKQLSTRAVELVKSLCNRCKGLTNAPTLDPTLATARRNEPITTGSVSQDPTNEANDIHWAKQIFQSIHIEVCIPSTSNLHKTACSQSSILLAKTLIKAGLPVDEVLDVYTRTQIKLLTDSEVGVQDSFFRDWIGWCGSVRGKLSAVTSDTDDTARINGQKEVEGINAEVSEQKTKKKKRKQSKRNDRIKGEN